MFGEPRGQRNSSRSDSLRPVAHGLPSQIPLQPHICAVRCFAALPLSKGIIHDLTPRVNNDELTANRFYFVSLLMRLLQRCYTSNRIVTVGWVSICAVTAFQRCLFSSQAWQPHTRTVCQPLQTNS